jgi:hypothetical protein
VRQRGQGRRERGVKRGMVLEKVKEEARGRTHGMMEAV